MCFLQVFADFLSFVVNFWPGDDFLGGSSAKTSIFPYNFLERQSCRDPYLSIRNSRRVGIGQAAVAGAYEPWFEVGAGEGLEEEGWLAVRCVRKEGG